MKRNISVDIVKGILITLIIIGHNNNAVRPYFYPFHLPSFFILSGFFLPDVSKLNPSFLKKQFVGLLLPYFSYLVLLGIPIVLFSDNTWYKTTFKLLLGGRALSYPLNPFWFISSLLGAYILYYFLEKFLRNKFIKLTAILIIYSLAHIEAYYFSSHSILFYFPFALDTSLIVVCYVYTGKLIKPFLFKLDENRRLLMVSFFSSLALASAVFYFIIFKNQNFIIDIKYIDYNLPVLNVSIGALFIVLLYSTATIFVKVFRFFQVQKVGNASLTIMYLHMPLISLLTFTNNKYIWVSIGVIIPTLIHYAISGKPKLSLFFTGKKVKTS